LQSADKRILSLWLLKIILSCLDSRSKIPDAVNLGSWKHQSTKGAGVKPLVRSIFYAVVKIKAVNVDVCLHMAS